MGVREESPLILEHRPATLADFIAHRNVLEPWYGPCGPEVERAWAGLLGHEGTWSLVIEDVEGPSRIVSLSLSVFVSDRFADRLESGRCPWIAGTLAMRFLARRRAAVAGPDPGRPQRRRAEPGLDSHGLAGSAAGPRLVRGRRRPAGKLFRVAMRGYRIKRVLREVFGPQAIGSFLAGGWRLRSDYSGYFEDSAKVPWIERPFLMGLNREEAAATGSGARASRRCSTSIPPARPAASPSRAAARRADGLTDAELSDRLSLSPSAVKKRWAAVYGHVEGKIPGMPPEAGRGDKTRGAERRRHVLNYLRDHAEEFRPLVD